MQAIIFFLKHKIMKNYSFFVGIDISKNSLDICCYDYSSTDKFTYHKIGNTPKTIVKFFKSLAKENTLICMEDTGVYGMYLYQILTELSYDFAVVPAIHIKRSKGLTRGKSDKADAKDIAKFASSHIQELELYKMPELAFQELKLLVNERDKLIEAIKVFQSTSESTCYVDPSLLKTLKRNNAKTIKHLAQQLIALEKEIKCLIARNETMNTQIELLQSIPGIGPQTALQLLIHSKCFTIFKNWRQLACYAGIAPFPYQSGSSIKGKTKVSHFAQKRLKSALHMASLTFKKNDTEALNYFNRKVAEGKNKMSIINAIRCKLVARAFAVINRGTPFVNTQKFAA